MTVVSVEQIWKGRGGEDATSSIGNTLRRHTRVWRAITDNRYDTETTVLADPRLPRYGSFLSSDPAAYCQRRKARNEDFSPRVWIATFLYSTEREINANPNFEPPKIRWNTEEYTEAALKDRNGDLITNSSNEPYDPEDPALQLEDDRWTVVVVQNVPAVPSYILSARKSVNSVAFTVDGVSVGVEHGLMRRIAIGEEQERGGFVYRVFSYALNLSDEKWNLELLDQGWKKLVAGKQVNIYNEEDGEAPRGQAPLLNGAGDVLISPSPATAQFNPFDVRRLFDFSNLPGIT